MFILHSGPKAMYMAMRTKPRIRKAIFPNLSLMSTSSFSANSCGSISQNTTKKKVPQARPWRTAMAMRRAGEERCVMRAQPIRTPIGEAREKKRAPIH